MATKRHLIQTKNLLAMIKKQLISMRKQLKMIFKQTFTKLIETKKHTNFDNNNIILEVNVNNNESTSKDKPE